MRAVGIRELKARISQFLRLVEAGESILVTRRGTVVAEVRPAGTTTQSTVPESGLAELIQAGRAVAPAPHDPGLYRDRPHALSEGTAAELLDAERGDG